jgi:hypothetical protein
VKFLVAAIFMLFYVVFPGTGHTTFHISQQQTLSVYSKESNFPVRGDRVESSDLLIPPVSNISHSTVPAAVLFFSEYNPNFCNPAPGKTIEYLQKKLLALLLIYPKHHFW